MRRLLAILTVLLVSGCAILGDPDDVRLDEVDSSPINLANSASSSDIGNSPRPDMAGSQYFSVQTPERTDVQFDYDLNIVVREP